MAVRAWLMLSLVVLLLVAGCEGGSDFQPDPNAPSYFNSLASYPIRWSNFPIRVYIDSESAPADRRQMFIGFVDAAFDAWARGASEITTTPVDASDSRPKISVAWVETLPRIDSGCTGGLTEPLVEGDKLLGMKVQIALLTQSGAPYTDRQIVTATLHEIGHALGILVHSTNPVDVMYASATALTPSARDLATIGELYAAVPAVTDVAIRNSQLTTSF